MRGMRGGHSVALMLVCPVRRSLNALRELWAPTAVVSFT
jgi:hypothetical protein